MTETSDISRDAAPGPADEQTPSLHTGGASLSPEEVRVVMAAEVLAAADSAATPVALRLLRGAVRGLEEAEAKAINPDDIIPVDWLRKLSYLELWGGMWAVFLALYILDTFTKAMFGFYVIEFGPNLLKGSLVAFLTCCGIKWGVSRRDLKDRKRAAAAAAS